MQGLGCGTQRIHVMCCAAHCAPTVDCIQNSCSKQWTSGSHGASPPATVKTVCRVAMGTLKDSVELRTVCLLPLCTLGSIFITPILSGAVAHRELE